MSVVIPEGIYMHMFMLKDAAVHSQDWHATAWDK